MVEHSKKIKNSENDLYLFGVDVEWLLVRNVWCLFDDVSAATASHARGNHLRSTLQIALTYSQMNLQ